MATFGKLTDGATLVTASSDANVVSTATPASSGTVQSLTVRAKLDAAGSAPIRGVIYSDVAGVPTTLLAVTDDGAVTSTTEGEVTLNFTGGNQISITNGTPYWIGVHWQFDAGPTIQVSKDNTATSRREHYEAFAGGSDASYVVDNSLSGPIDVYVTYTPSTSPSASVSPSASQSPSASASPSVSPSASISPSASLSPSSSVSPSLSPSASRSPSASASPSLSPSASISPSVSPSSSVSPSLSPSSSASASSSPSASVSPSSSASASASPSASASLSVSPSASASASSSASAGVGWSLDTILCLKQETSITAVRQEDQIRVAE